MEQFIINNSTLLAIMILTYFISIHVVGIFMKRAHSNKGIWYLVGQKYPHHGAFLIWMPCLNTFAAIILWTTHKPYGRMRWTMRRAEYKIIIEKYWKDGFNQWFYKGWLFKVGEAIDSGYMCEGWETYEEVEERCLWALQRRVEEEARKLSHDSKKARF